MKQLSIFMLTAPVLLSAVSYGDISFDTSPYVHPDFPDLTVGYDHSLPDGYMLQMGQDGQTANSMWQRLISSAEIPSDPKTDSAFIIKNISPGNYKAVELSTSVYDFDIKRSFVRYGWDKSSIYGSVSESFYINKYKGGALKQFTIDGFDDFIYEKSYDLKSLTSWIYIVILIGLLVFSTIRMKIRIRSV